MRSMKKYCILLSELWLCAFFLLTGCAGTKGAEEKKSIRIGVSLYRGDDTFLNNIRGELERCAKDFEQEKGVKVTLDIQDARGNQNTQNDQVERFLALGCDVLCINPVDRTAASVLIDKAMAAQTPVIFFNRQPVEEDMDRWDRIFYVGAEAKSSAVLQGSIVVDGYRKNPEKLDLNGDGVVSYVLLEGESSHQDSLIRTEWSVQTLKDGGVPIEKLTGGIANWERSQASALMEQWLEKYPGRIELVICNNDDMALGAIDAMERAGMEGIAVVGIDGTTPGLAAVESGKLMGTVAIDRAQYAGAILAIATGEALGWEPDAKLEFEDGKYYQCPWQIVVKK
ncbi:galactose ABC transporter substrate-binding protein [Lachnospiraceae bacterium 54-11]